MELENKMEVEKEGFLEKELKEEISKSNSENKEQEPAGPKDVAICLSLLLLILGLICTLTCSFSSSESRIVDVPNITIAFMNFTVFDINTRLSAKWNLLIRVPENLPGSYICLQGDFQASLLYKNITIATSPARSYKNLQSHWPQLLMVSGVVSEEDINGAIGKNIMNDIKEGGEVRLGSWLFLPVCRKYITGTMKFACEEIKMQYDSSFQKITSTAVGHPTCVYDHHYILV